MTHRKPRPQNIPIKTERGREIRRSLMNDPNRVFIQPDYSGLELQIAAQISRSDS